MKILLVDDEAKFATMLAKRLTLREIEVDCAFTCAEAEKRAKDKAYDVAILDVKMPGIGGIEIAQRLRPVAPGMKIIFLTGHGSENDFKSAANKAAYYLVKPIQIEQLIDILQELTQ